MSSIDRNLNYFLLRILFPRSSYNLYSTFRRYLWCNNLSRFIYILFSFILLTLVLLFILVHRRKKLWTLIYADLKCNLSTWKTTLDDLFCRIPSGFPIVYYFFPIFSTQYKHLPKGAAKCSPLLIYSCLFFSIQHLTS